MSCEFCQRAQFDEFGVRIDKYGVGISLAAGCYRFPKDEQFKFCPVCGESLIKPEPLTMENLEVK